MDQGIVFAFDDSGIDPATFGFPLWDEVWSKVIIVGSTQAALSSGQGGRMNLRIKCVEGPNMGKEHIIGLNIWHPEEDTKKRAYEELTSITHVTGKHKFNNTGELYNIPFYVLPATSTSKPTQQYPNPTPRTNFRGYRDLNGNEPGKGNTGGGAPAGNAPNFGGGAPAGGGAPNFGQPQQQQGQPQFGGAPQGNGGFTPQQNAPANGANGQAWGQGPNGGGAAGAMTPNASGNQWNGGGNAQSPFNGQPNPGQPVQGGEAPPWGGTNGGQPMQGQPQQFQQQQPMQQQQQPQQGWNPQGAPAGQPQQGGWNPNG